MKQEPQGLGRPCHRFKSQAAVLATGNSCLPVGVTHTTKHNTGCNPTKLTAGLHGRCGPISFGRPELPSMQSSPGGASMVPKPHGTALRCCNQGCALGVGPGPTSHCTQRGEAPPTVKPRAHAFTLPQCTRAPPVAHGRALVLHPDECTTAPLDTDPPERQAHAPQSTQQTQCGTPYREPHRATHSTTCPHQSLQPQEPDPSTRAWQQPRGMAYASGWRSSR